MQALIELNLSKNLLYSPYLFPSYTLSHRDSLQFQILNRENYVEPFINIPFCRLFFLGEKQACKFSFFFLVNNMINDNKFK